MKVVAVINGKGGVGKTTISTHVAVSAGRLGLVTAVLDLDPQPSSTLWADSREASDTNPRPTVTPAQAARLPVYLKQAREQQADLIIIDTPPRVEGAAPVAAEHADAILIPTPPKPLDIVALPQTIQLARASRKPKARQFRALAKLGGRRFKLCSMPLLASIWSETGSKFTSRIVYKLTERAGWPAYAAKGRAHSTLGGSQAVVEAAALDNRRIAKLRG